MLQGRIVPTTVISHKLFLTGVRQILYVKPDTSDHQSPDTSAKSDDQN